MDWLFVAPRPEMSHDDWQEGSHWSQSLVVHSLNTGDNFVSSWAGRDARGCVNDLT